jgi:hypothetical protein
MRNHQRARRRPVGADARLVLCIIAALAAALLCPTHAAVRGSAQSDAATPPCPFGPRGPEFRLKATGVDWPTHPAVAADDEGNFVLAWVKTTQVGQSSRTDIYAQRFDASGIPAGAEFRVNPDATAGNSSPAVALGDGGRFVIAWLSGSGFGPPTNVYAKYYAGAGGPSYSVTVNTYTAANDIRSVSAAMRAGGGFVVSYVGDYLTPPGTRGHVFARLFNTPGAPTKEFMVDVPSDLKLETAAAMNDAGDFVVVWRELEEFGRSMGIYARRYDAAGAAKGPGFRVSTHRGNGQRYAAAAMDAAGGLVVAWSSWMQDGSDYGVYAQRFDASGARAGEEFRVNSYTGDDQRGPSVAVGVGGDFVVAWENAMRDGTEVFARRYDASGGALGEELLISQTTDGFQYGPELAALAEGGFVAAWVNFAPAGSGVYARHFGEDCVTPPGATARFGAAEFEVGEGCVPASLTVRVERPAGVAPAEVTVEYAVTGGTVSQRGDYTYAAGRVTFAPGEAEREITVLVSEDGYAEGPETVRLTLLNPSGAALGSPASATLTINDNDAADSGANPIDDPRNFICQHYHDFLQRQPDPAGEAFWAEKITRCGTDAGCVAATRVLVSSAFFLSIEHLQTAYFAGRLYEACLGRRPSFEEYMRDVQRLGLGVRVGYGDWEQRIELNKRAFAEDFVRRPEFKAKYPEGMAADAYVGAMFWYAGVTPTDAESRAAVDAYGAGETAGRAAALRAAMESAGVFRAFYNRGFVLSEYFGYLRRGPDADGYDYWLRKMDAFSLPGEDVTLERDALARVARGEMVRAFTESSEYRLRFGEQ